MVLALVGAAAASVIITTLRVGISPMPSSALARRAMLELSGDGRSDTLVELGAGFGAVAVGLARRHPRATVIAYECSFVPWLVTRLRALTVRNLVVRRADFLEADLSGASLLVCYLFTGGMQALEAKLRRERLQLAVITNTFRIRGLEPDQVVRLDDLYRSEVARYGPRRWT